MKKFLKIIACLTIVGLVAWIALYFTVPKVKEWTNDNVFKIEASKKDDEKESLKAENDDLKSQIETLNKTVADSSTQLQGVKSELQSTQTALETATAEKTELESTVSTLTKKVESLESSSNATELDLAQAKADLATAQENLQTKTAEVETLTNQKNQLETNVENLTAEISTLASEKQSLENQVADMSGKLSTLETEKSNLEKNVQDLEQNVSELEQSGSATSAELEKTKSDLATAQENLQTKSEEIETLTNQKNQLETNVASLNNQISTLTSEKQTLETNVSDLNNQINTLTSEKQALEQQVQSLNKQVEDLTSEKNKTSILLEQTQAQLKTTENNLQAKTAEADSLASDKAELETKKAELESTVATQLQQIETLQNRVDALEEAIGYEGEKLYLSDVVDGKTIVEYYNHDDEYALARIWGKEKATTYLVNKTDNHIEELGLIKDETYSGEDNVWVKRMVLNDGRVFVNFGDTGVYTMLYEFNWSTKKFESTSIDFYLDSSICPNQPSGFIVSKMNDEARILNLADMSVITFNGVYSLVYLGQSENYLDFANDWGGTLYRVSLQDNTVEVKSTPDAYGFSASASEEGLYYTKIAETIYLQKYDAYFVLTPADFAFSSCRVCICCFGDALESKVYDFSSNLNLYGFVYNKEHKLEALKDERFVKISYQNNEYEPIYFDLVNLEMLTALPEVVTFEVDGVATSEQYVTTGSTATTPEAPTKDGYTFDGWLLNGEGDVLTDVTSVTISADTTFVAKFTAIDDGSGDSAIDSEKPNQGEETGNTGDKEESSFGRG